MFLMILLSPILENCASAATAVTFEIPAAGVAGQKIGLKVHSEEALPASSFYRVELECPKKPEGARVALEMGYPASDIVFDRAGRYECVAQVGIVTKSSCAGASYKPLGEHNFVIEIGEN